MASQLQLWFHRSLCASATHQRLFLSHPIVPTDSRYHRRNVVVSQHHNHKGPRKERAVVLKGNKENVWSVDNGKSDAASKGTGERSASSRRSQRGKRAVRKKRSKSNGRPIMVSASMLMEVETLLQTQVR